MSVAIVARRGTRALGPLGLALLLALGLPAVSAGAAPGAAGRSTVTRTIYHGSAWGSTVVQDQAITSGHSAPVTLACVTLPGTTYQNSVASVNVQTMFHTGEVVDTASAIAQGGLQTAKETSTVHNLSMIDGMVKADFLKSVSRTTRHSDGSYTFSTVGSQFGGLVINGQAMNQAPEHQIIELPGLGRIILFQHAKSIRGTVAQQFVNMLTIEILHQNDQGIPVGTRMVIAHALSRMSRAAGPLGGRAWGSRLKAGDTLESGPSFTTYLPCTGTKGVLLKQSGLAANLPAPISLGTITNTAQGTVGLTETKGETTSSIANVDLGDGQITADLIKADTAVDKKAGAPVFDTSGSHFGGLVVNGEPQSASPDPNTVIEIPNLGRVILYEVTKGKHFAIVRMFHLKVLEDNPDFPVGTDLVLGYSKISVH
ncbi:MAG TPA: choice-of-anchor P family protein [Actinomycetota bacterium]